ncbi:GNAT family N-acetyltransferase [Limibacter armeniacum]|uniref:GNAT family N-acetyltransferase n=1 Tax=Limibacter armeniacum TaxID=466084 RepID=UPI002FE65EDB
MEIKLADSDSELLQILEVQKQNHLDYISSDDMKVKGFVTVMHNLELLKEMNNKAKHVIAVEDGKVVGYALTMVKELSEKVPILVPMFDTFEIVDYQGKKLSQYNYYVMGQVCVADSHKGKGVFRAMYSKHKEVFSGLYDLCLTEVSYSNQRSMKAHEKVGFKVIKTFKDETDEWNIIGWDWS